MVAVVTSSLLALFIDDEDICLRKVQRVLVLLDLVMRMAISKEVDWVWRKLKSEWIQWRNSWALRRPRLVR